MWSMRYGRPLTEGGLNLPAKGEVPGVALPPAVAEVEDQPPGLVGLGLEAGPDPALKARRPAARFIHTLVGPGVFRADRCAAFPDGCSSHH